MLSVVIITQNEENNIRRCLESVEFADEIIVLDSGSTDQTVNIAKQYTDKVYVNHDWKGYGLQKQRALSYATGDWVLNLDADESVGAPLKKAIIRIMTSNQADAYCVPIQMNFYGKKLRYASSPSRHIRLFKREGAEYSNHIVHEKIILPTTARIDKLSTPIEHHCYRDLSHALAKMNRYSSYSAAIRLSESKKTTLTHALFSSIWMFFRCFIVQRGFMDGRAGFALAAVNAHAALYRGLKQVFPDDPSVIPSKQ